MVSFIDPTERILKVALGSEALSRLHVSFIDPTERILKEDGKGSHHIRLGNVSFIDPTERILKDIYWPGQRGVKGKFPSSIRQSGY